MRSQFGFYNPLSGKIVDYDKLAQLSKKPNCPAIVSIIDIENHKKLGKIPTFEALHKYRP